MSVYILNKPVAMEETRFFEFKEVKGSSPINSIKNTCDEYAVAFLNSNSGSIFWGIRDQDRIVVGVFVNYRERDDLRKKVVNKISAIKPSISPSAYQINFHEVVDEKGFVIEDYYVVELAILESVKTSLCCTGGNDVFMKTDSGKKKLTISEIEDEVLRRARVNSEPSESHKKQIGVPDLQVGIGESFGYDDEIVLSFQSFYKNVDVVDMFVQVEELFVSKFLGNEYYEKSNSLNRSDLFSDSAYIGKLLKRIKANTFPDRVLLKPNESAHVLFLESVSDAESLIFGFDAANSTELRKKVWRKSGTYEVYVNVFGKINNEVAYRKRTFVVLVRFVEGSVIEVEHFFKSQ